MLTNNLRLDSNNRPIGVEQACVEQALQFHWLVHLVVSRSSGGPNLRR